MLLHYYPNLQSHSCYFRRKWPQNDAKKKLCCKYKLLWISHSSIYLTHHKNAISVCCFSRNPTQLVNSWNSLDFFIHSTAGTFPLCPCWFDPSAVSIPTTFKKPPELKLLGAARQDPTGTKRKILHPPAGWHRDKFFKCSRFLSDFSILVLHVIIGEV